MGTKTRKPKVLVFGSNIHPVGLDMLREVSDLEFVNTSDDDSAIVEKAKNASAFFVRGGKITGKLIRETAPSLQIIARHGMGVDNVDVEAATKMGIVVTTTGPANSQAVAEYTFALLLSLIRHTCVADKIVRGGAWRRESLIGTELGGKVMGVVGLGQIGSKVAVIAKGFSMRVLAYDPYLEIHEIHEAAERGVELVNLEKLLAESDFISLHVPYNRDTHHMFDSATINSMKDKAVLINTCRGGVVDQRALKEALKSGKIAGAALDTFEEEPIPPGEDLVTFDNVIMSPHVGAQTEESLYRMSLATAQAIRDKLEGRTPKYVFNRKVLEKASKGGVQED
jgi:D-3-phosphoglycerate dehydrogenase